MDKEGQSTQFSSEKISEKTTPDYFIASNDKSEKRRRFIGLDKAKTKFQKFVTRLKDYFKHPIRGKHKILTIILLVLAAALVVLLIVFSQTIWRAKTRDYTPLGEGEIGEWLAELSTIVNEAKQKDDETFDSYYKDKIDNEWSEYKYNDLRIAYANELSIRGYIDTALSVLDQTVAEDLDCYQMEKYYDAYYLAYFIIGDGNDTMDQYRELADRQEAQCILETYNIDINTSSNDEGDN